MRGAPSSGCLKARRVWRGMTCAGSARHQQSSVRGARGAQGLATATGRCQQGQQMHARPGCSLKAGSWGACGGCVLHKMQARRQTGSVPPRRACMLQLRWGARGCASACTTACATAPRAHPWSQCCSCVCLQLPSKTHGRTRPCTHAHACRWIPATSFFRPTICHLPHTEVARRQALPRQ